VFDPSLIVYTVYKQKSTTSTREKHGNTETRTVTELLNLGSSRRATMAGLTVSPDGQWILYTRTDAYGSDLMRVEGLH